MTTALTGHRAGTRAAAPGASVRAVPASWPAALSPDCLEVIDVPTPYLVTDLDTVARRHAAFSAALPESVGLRRSRTETALLTCFVLGAFALWILELCLTERTKR